MSSTTEIIATVRRELDELQRKIDDINSKKTELDKEIFQVREDMKRREDLLLVWEGKADVKPMIQRRTRGRARRGGFTMNNLILEIMEQYGRPMSAHEILDELSKRSAAGSSKSPISSVRNALQILKKRNQILNPAYGVVCLPGQEGSVASAPKVIRRAKGDA